MHGFGPKVGVILLIGGCLGSIFAPCAESPTAPASTDLQREAALCRDLLRKSVFDFYFPACVDVVNGGYLEDWRDGKFVARGERFLTLQARQLWFFSTLASENIERTKCLQAARNGYIFLDRSFHDARNGGYISRTDDRGTPTDTRKHLYHNSFALYALVAYYQATKDRAALERAQDLFRVLELRAHDAQFGGYAEFFYADWRPVTNPTESRDVGAIGTKTYNTHLHLLESFTALYKVWPDARLRARLEELVSINTSTVQHPVHRCNIDGWLPDWHMVNLPANLKASYGHDVECVWLVLDAVRALGISETLYRNWAQAVGGYSLEHGYDTEHGGFFYTGPLGGAAEDTRKEWWVQAEALVGLLELYRISGDSRYYDAFVKTLGFVEHYQIAPDGGWWATRNEDGSAHREISRSSMWQGAYHSGRALLFSARLLSTLKPASH